MDDVYSWDQVLSQGLKLSVDHPTLGSVDLPGPPLRFDDNTFAGGRSSHVAPPTLGQHNESIREWLDSSDTLTRQGWRWVSADSTVVTGRPEPHGRDPPLTPGVRRIRDLDPRKSGAPDPSEVPGDPSEMVRATFLDAGFEEVAFVRPDDDVVPGRRRAVAACRPDVRSGPCGCSSSSDSVRRGGGPATVVPEPVRGGRWASNRRPQPVQSGGGPATVVPSPSGWRWASNRCPRGEALLSPPLPWWGRCPATAPWWRRCSATARRAGGDVAKPPLPGGDVAQPPLPRGERLPIHRCSDSGS